MATRVQISSILLLLVFTTNLLAKPAPQDSDESSSEENVDGGSDNSTYNGTHKELYVIRQVVYEVGVLVDVNDTDSDENSTTSKSSDSSELVDDQIQLTIFGASHNGSLEFGDVPLPVQVNSSGQVMTGLQPVHVGQISNLTALADALPFSGTIVNVTKSESTYLVPDKLNSTDTEGVVGETDNDSLLNKFSAIKDNLPPIGAGTL